MGIAALSAEVVRAGAVDTRIPGPSVDWSGSLPIPDNNAGGATVELLVAGLEYPMADVTLSVTLTHTWVGDLRARLISPGGLARLELFGRPGYRKSGNAGVSSNLSGTYVFDDFASGDLWTIIAPLTSAGNVPPGTYRTSSSSRLLQSSTSAGSSSGGCTTHLSGAFGGLTPAQANGLWTLVVVDQAGGDLGTITAAELTVNYPSLIYRNGVESYQSASTFSTAAFESLGSNQAPITGSSVRGSCIPAQFDLTGDGLTDYTLVRNELGAGHWYLWENSGTGAGTASDFELGDPATDFFLADDFDDDGIDDAAVWTLGSPGVFRVRRSSRPTDTVVEVRFGQAQNGQDDPTQSGDFDGDGVADLAVFVAPPFGGADGPVFWQYLPSTEGAFRVTTVGTGLLGVAGDHFPVAGFDSNGDGVADFALQTAKIGDLSVGHWHRFDGATGSPIDEFDLGLSSDFILPGNHVGNFQADVTIRRTVSGNRNHWFRDGQTGTESGPTIHGIVEDQSVPGDYDGDGLDDLAVFRASATPGLSKFLIRKSSAPDPLLEVFLGQLDDVPIAGSRVH